MAGDDPDEEGAVDAVLQRLARAARFRDEETAEHVERMSRSCALIAAELGWEQSRCMALRAASALHDIGKVGVPDAVLRKPGQLDPQERALVERHPEIGHEILAGDSEPVFELGATVALNHHERFDGAGYPGGLSGRAIPIEGRIAAVADVFDALSHDRVYRPAFKPDDAIEMMREGRGSQFDPSVFDAFEQVLPEILELSRRYPDSWESPPPFAGEGGNESKKEDMSVLVVEKHEAIAKGLALLLQGDGFRIAGNAQDIEHARGLLTRRRPDVAVIDLDLGGESGLDLLPAAQAAGTRALVYSDRCEPAVLAAAKQAGAAGLIAKASSSYELLQAVRILGSGGTFVDQRFKQGVGTARPASGLTPREHEVVALLAAGCTGEEIATRLFLSPDTVRTHIRNAMARLGARTRAHLVTLAAKQEQR